MWESFILYSVLILLCLLRGLISTAAVSVPQSDKYKNYLFIFIFIYNIQPLFRQIHHNEPQRLIYKTQLLLNQTIINDETPTWKSDQLICILFELSEYLCERVYMVLFPDRKVVGLILAFNNNNSGSVCFLCQWFILMMVFFSLFSPLCEAFWLTLFFLKLIN